MVIDLGRRVRAQDQRRRSRRGSPIAAATTRRSSRRSWRSSRFTSTRRRNRPRSSITTRSTRSARTCARAISRGSPIWRWPASWRELADELARLPAGGREAIPVVRVAPAAAADAGAGAGPDRARRSARRRHDVTRQVFVLEGQAARRRSCCRSGMRSGLATVAERAGRLERELDVQRRRRTGSARRGAARDRPRRRARR